MPEPTSVDTVDPPRLRRVRPGGRPVGQKPTASKVGGRRGRPSQDDYAWWVIAMARADLFQLEECALLAQLPGGPRFGATLSAGHSADRGSNSGIAR